MECRVFVNHKEIVQLSLQKIVAVVARKTIAPQANQLKWVIRVIWDVYITNKPVAMVWNVLQGTQTYMK